MSAETNAMPEVVRALVAAGIDHPEVFLRPTYTPCACGGWDERLVPVTGGKGRPGRPSHARACAKHSLHLPADLPVAVAGANEDEERADDGR